MKVSGSVGRQALSSLGSPPNAPPPHPLQSCLFISLLKRLLTTKHNRKAKQIHHPQLQPIIVCGQERNLNALCIKPPKF